MTTTTRRPRTAAEHTAEARRLLTLVRREALEGEAWQEYSANYACDPQAVAAVASAHIALALVEEQRTANLVAAYIGSHEHDVWWSKTAGDLTERVGVQR